MMQSSLSYAKYLILKPTHLLIMLHVKNMYKSKSV